MSCAINAWDPHGAPPAPLQAHPLYFLARGAWRALGAPRPTGWSDGPGHLCLHDTETGALVELNTSGAEVALRWLAVDPTGRVPPQHGHGGRAEANAGLLAYAQQAEAAPASLLTAARFFALVEDAAPDLRLELIDGRIVAMAGASPRHNALVGSVIAAFTQALDHTDCVVLGSDQYTAVDEATTYTLPDVIIQCEPMKLGESAGKSHWLTNPTIVIEVISPESASRDQTTKPQRFLSMPSVEAYLTFRPDRPEVTIWRRGAATQEVVTTGGVQVHNVIVPLSLLYQGLARLERLNRAPLRPADM